MSIEFTWDNAKAIGNLNKHGVSFEEAKTAFLMIMQDWCRIPIFQKMKTGFSCSA